MPYAGVSFNAPLGEVGSWPGLRKDEFLLGKDRRDTLMPHLRSARGYGVEDQGYYT